MHDATPQVVVLPTRLVQEVALVPSQTFEEQALFDSDCGQAGRVPTGGPVIVTQVPTLPAVLHAWHWPLQAVLQQTPSTQGEPEGHSSDAVHWDPMGPCFTVTVMVAVPVLPTASVAVTTSVPALVPAT
jgi:hypothetical protein